MPSTVSIVITNYNGKNVLPETLASVSAVKGPVIEVILADDGSTDRSIEVARSVMPAIRVVGMERNTALVNKVRNAGIRAASGNFVFLIDNDIQIDPDCVVKLLEAHGRLEKAAVLTPRLLYSNQKDRIFTDGQRLHYVGQSIGRNRNKLVDEAGTDVLENTAGGGIVLIDKAKAASVGFYNESYRFGWGDDGEMFFRLVTSGWKTYHVPQAVCYHHPKTRTTQRARAQVYNRWMYIVENYAAKTLFLIAPALALYEIMQAGVLTVQGAGADYWAANVDVMRDFGLFLTLRRRTQASRTAPDREFVSSGDVYVPPGLLRSWMPRVGLKAFNVLFNAYWRLVRRFI